MELSPFDVVEPVLAFDVFVSVPLVGMLSAAVSVSVVVPEEDPP